MIRMQASQRINLEKEWGPGIITANVYTPTIAATQNLPCPQSDLFGLLYRQIRFRSNWTILHQIFTPLLIDIRIDTRFRSGMLTYLHRAEDASC